MSNSERRTCGRRKDVYGRSGLLLYSWYLHIDQETGKGIWRCTKPTRGDDVSWRPWIVAEELWIEQEKLLKSIGHRVVSYTEGVPDNE